MKITEERTYKSIYEISLRAHFLRMSGVQEEKDLENYILKELDSLPFPTTVFFSERVVEILDSMQSVNEARERIIAAKNALVKNTS